MNSVPSKFIYIFAIILLFSLYIEYTNAGSIFGSDTPNSTTTMKPTTTSKPSSGATMEKAYYTVIGSVLIAITVCRYSI
ncbi:unnamed protein product [Schistosoma margrebowiei]|uniref:Uncharacterized protein n=1 Tax=Schistosoma margrebowiei TaxID=48269 RepID=A0AA85AJI0_9TREM|nr:unnamed protein product [Schistosoma margrebowiei]